MRTSRLETLPPVFTPILHLREGKDALRRAIALAPEKGAGTLVWSSALHRVEAAVVLEPERILAASRPAFLVAANALADALTALAAPELPVTLRWPATLALNGGEIGALTLATPPDAGENDVPAWMVVGFSLRLAAPEQLEPGLTPDHTTLATEGQGDITAEAIVGAWARHLLANMNEWEERPARLGEKYFARLETAPWQAGARRGLDPVTGDLILEREGTRQRHPLAS
ncbi:MAG: biotin/lipoate--protein ligase family protein [Pseudomonadota bacterium]